MGRLGMCVVVCGLALTPGLAEGGKKKDCRTYGALAQQAADLRAAGQSADDILPQLIAPYAGADNKFTRAAPILVDWVMTLPKDQLGMDVAGAYRAACIAN